MYGQSEKKNGFLDATNSPGGPKSNIPLTCFIPVRATKTHSQCQCTRGLEIHACIREYGSIYSLSIQSVSVYERLGNTVLSTKRVENVVFQSFDILFSVMVHAIETLDIPT